MGFSTSLRPHIPASYGYAAHYFEFCSARVHGKRKTLPYVTTTARCCSFHSINSVLGARKSSINSNGEPEPARALLERLFVQTQKLEDQMNGNSHLVDDVKSGFDLENLESDLLAALEALRKKEEDLQEADRIVKLENAELCLAREELDQREKKIAAACSKQEKLEEELRQANLKLVSQARDIEDLKLRLNQRDQEISLVEFVVSSKETEIDKMKRELTQKNTEAAKSEAEIASKAKLLDEANAVVKKQELEVQVLQSALHEKQLELEELLAQQQLEEEKVKTAESKLEQQTMEWLLAQEELKELGELASKHIGESKETMEGFQRVKRLLADVRSELVSSQQSLVTSRQRVEERELLLEKQLLDLEEQNKTTMSYINSLKSAHIEVESERAKLRVAEFRNKELELDLALKKDLMQGLQGELDKEKTSLQQANLELSSIREELDYKSNEFEETSKLLGIMERELVEARLEIQHLKSEHQSLQVVLQERDLELVAARKRLDEVNTEVTELRILLNGKEEQLIATTNMLREKEDYAQAMQHELNHAKVMASEAESVVGRILDLTNGLVISSKEDDPSALLTDVDHFPSQLVGKPSEDTRWQKKQMEAELELTRENLRTKEMELLAAQTQLTIKDEELKMIRQRIEEKDAELKDLKEETLRDTDELKQLSVYAQGGAEEDRIQELGIEKLQLEAAQLEVEAATSALQNLVEMSRHLLNKATLCIDADLDVNVLPSNEVHSESSLFDYTFLGFEHKPTSNEIQNNECLVEVQSEVARLAALTERLVQEAGAAP